MHHLMAITSDATLPHSSNAQSALFFFRVSTCPSTCSTRQFPVSLFRSTSIYPNTSLSQPCASHTLSSASFHNSCASLHCCPCTAQLAPSSPARTTCPQPAPALQFLSYFTPSSKSSTLQQPCEPLHICTARPSTHSLSCAPAFHVTLLPARPPRFQPGVGSSVLVGRYFLVLLAPVRSFVFSNCTTSCPTPPSSFRTCLAIPAYAPVPHSTTPPFQPSLPSTAYHIAARDRPWPPSTSTSASQLVPTQALARPPPLSRGGEARLMPHSMRSTNHPRPTTKCSLSPEGDAPRSSTSVPFVPIQNPSHVPSTSPPPAPEHRSMTGAPPPPPPSFCS